VRGLGFIWMRERERERGCRRGGGLRWKVREWDAVDDDDDDAGWAISMLSEIAQPFDSHRHHAVPQFREPRRQDVRRASAPTWSQINRGWGTVRYWSPSYYNSPRPRVN